MYTYTYLQSLTKCHASAQLPFVRCGLKCGLVHIHEQTMTNENRSVVKSADRVLDILEVLAQKGRPLTHSDLSKELGIPKSSMSQLLGNLADRHYLLFTPGPNTYAIGERLLHLVERQRKNVTLPKLAQPLCDRITRITGESSSLNLRRDGGVERVCGSNSTQPLTFSMNLGEIAPLYAVSSGKVLLAYMSEEELADYLKVTKLVAITKKTVTSAALLKGELDKIRKRGAAWSLEEFTPGIVGVAVPAFHDGTVVGAFNIAMPSVRDSPAHREHIVRVLKDAAVSLGKDIEASAQK